MKAYKAADLAKKARERVPWQKHARLVTRLLQFAVYVSNSKTKDKVGGVIDKLQTSRGMTM